MHMHTLSQFIMDLSLGDMHPEHLGFGEEPPENVSLDFSKATGIFNMFLQYSPFERKLEISHQACPMSQSIERFLVSLAFSKVLRPSLCVTFGQLSQCVRANAQGFLEWLCSISYIRSHLFGLVVHDDMREFIQSVAEAGNVPKFVWGIKISKHFTYSGSFTIANAKLRCIDVPIPSRLFPFTDSAKIATWLSVFTRDRVRRWFMNFKFKCANMPIIIGAIEMSHPELLKEKTVQHFLLLHDERSHVRLANEHGICIQLKHMRKSKFDAYIKKCIRKRSICTDFAPRRVVKVLRKMIAENFGDGTYYLKNWLCLDPTAYAILSNVPRRDLLQLFKINLPQFSDIRAIALWTAQGMNPPKYVTTRWASCSFSILRKLCNTGRFPKETADVIKKMVIYSADSEKEWTHANIKWVLSGNKKHLLDFLASDAPHFHQKLLKYLEIYKNPDKTARIIQTWWRRVYIQNERLRMNIARAEYQSLLENGTA